MGTYSKIVSTVKPINSIRTFVGGVAKDITSAWTFVNGVRKQVFPTTEVWTLVYSKDTAGSFSYSAGWGKYKIELSGGGGSGAATARAHVGYSHSETAGSNGELITVIHNVESGTTRLFDGTVGSGASGSKAQSKQNESISFVPSNSVGAAGSGYANGSQGTSGWGRSGGNPFDYSSAVSGSGGGSSNIVFHYSGGSIGQYARGGNGGNAVAKTVSQQYGGVGGSGGVSSGSGAAGGAAVTGYDNTTVTSGAGSDGYVKIYKSNIYPA